MPLGDGSENEMRLQRAQFHRLPRIQLGRFRVAEVEFELRDLDRNGVDELRRSPNRLAIRIERLFSPPEPAQVARELRVDVDEIGIVAQDLSAQFDALAIATFLIEHER